MSQVADEWYYVHNAQAVGPVPLAQLKANARSGVLKPADKVWRNPMPNWVEARTLPELFAPGATPPPVPAQAPMPVGYANPQHAPARDIGQDAGMRMLLPVGRSGWAIAAGYCGLLAIIPPISLLAVVFGLLAIREMRRDPNKHGMGRALTGLILGGLFTLVHLAVLASFFIPA